MASRSPQARRRLGPLLVSAYSCKKRPRFSIAENAGEFDTFELAFTIAFACATKSQAQSTKLCIGDRHRLPNPHGNFGATKKTVMSHNNRNRRLQMGWPDFAESSGRREKARNNGCERKNSNA